jgi:phenylpropionate dioxygenase-like ring-hydroxylating dioxygenase large terminal subunit
MKHDQNMLLTRTGAGEPMGDLFRRYWIPILVTSELPEADCPPVRVKVLGERLVAFRDSEGKLGLIDEFCAHRGVSLWFGRNEECGLRCPYHGWKFDVTGQCVDVPSEPVESGYAKKIKLTSYPLVEGGGILWTYMGPPEAQPEFPGFEWLNLPKGHIYVSKRLQECNYLQAMEGGIDSSHVSWLHSGELHTDPLHRSTQGAKYQGDRKPKFEIVESEGGLLIGARRQAEPGNYYWRITQWIMPWYTMIPPYGDNALNGHAWTPIDDENCWAWTFTYHPTRPLTDEELKTMVGGGGIHVEYVPGTFRPVINKDNDYMIDRAAQKAGRTYSGVHGIAMQDASVQESMGPIVDRTRENLCTTDNAIIMARQRLMKAAAALAKGNEPPGLTARCHAVRSAAFVLPETEPFHSAKPEAFVAKQGISHTSI